MKESRGWGHSGEEDTQQISLEPPTAVRQEVKPAKKWPNKSLFLHHLFLGGKALRSSECTHGLGVHQTYARVCTSHTFPSDKEGNV